MSGENALEFEQHRHYLERVAYRMLGSASEAEDAVQDAWLRLSRADADAVENLRGWLTTVVARICLDLLRARRRQATDELGDIEPVVSPDLGPEDEALLADCVGVALLVVLDTLTPPERLAFVLHDMFAVPFDEIGEILDRTPETARQLASRARRRVRGAAPSTDPDREEQRRLVDAFLAASRGGDFEALVAVLHPEAVFRVRGAVPTATTTGAEEVARRVLARGSRFAHLGRLALVDGMPGVVVGPAEAPFSVVAFTVSEGRIRSLDVFVHRPPQG
jgi:RNA polymerase sigma-70 factor, ECF subfamily